MFENILTMKVFQLMLYHDQLQQQVANIKETTEKLVGESMETSDHQQHVTQVQEQLRKIQQTKECVHDCQEVYGVMKTIFKIYIFLSQTGMAC